MAIQELTPSEARAVAGATFSLSALMLPMLSRGGTLPGLGDLPLLGAPTVPVFSFFGDIYDAVVDGVLAVADAVEAAVDVLPFP